MRHLFILAALTLGTGYSSAAEAATCQNHTHKTTSAKKSTHKTSSAKKRSHKTSSVKVKAGVSIKVTRKPYDRHPEKPRCTKVWVPGHYEGIGRKRHYVKGHWEVRR